MVEDHICIELDRSEIDIGRVEELCVGEDKIGDDRVQFWGDQIGGELGEA